MRSTIILAVVFVVTGCGADAPTAVEAFDLQFTESGTSGCHTVSGVIAQTGVFPSFSGSISGDVVGTVVTQIDPASRRVAGKVTFTSGVQTWQVTGGTVTELIGRQVRLTLDSEVVLAQPPVARNNTTARILDGAESGNLTYHGTVDTSPPPPFALTVQYRGVICP